MRVVVSTLAVWLLVMLPTAGWPAAASPPLLFDAPGSVRTARTAAFGAHSRATVRQRTVAARLDLLAHPDGSAALAAGHRVRLNLFDDADFSMIVTEVSRHPGGGLTWGGTLDGVDLGSAALAVYDGALVGHVSTPGATYRIGHAPDGTPVVEEVDQAAFPAETDPVDPVETGVLALDEAPPDAAADSASQIDVLVLYTAAARIQAGGTTAVRAEAALAVAASNQAYGNNGLAHRLRLVYTGETSITETGNFSADLTRVKGDANTAWLRNVTRADLVSLLTSNGPSPSTCGIGYLLTTNSVLFESFGFSVVDRTCASSNLTFSHELGHNMGGHHDPYVAGNDATLSPYSHGFVDLVGKFRTIMAYNDLCAASGFNCTRIQFFSTPGKTLNGRALGNGATSDNTRTLGATGNTIANFRQALTSPLTLVAAVNQSTFAVGQTLSTSVSVNHPGGVAGAVDFYVGVVFPNGSAVFFTDVKITPTGGYALGNITNFSTYRPIATGVPLAAGFSANLPVFFSYPRGAGDPTGGFAFFVLAVKTGALADGALATDELVSASFAPFTFPAGPPLDEVSQ